MMCQQLEVWKGDGGGLVGGSYFRLLHSPLLKLGSPDAAPGWELARAEKQRSWFVLRPVDGRVELPRR